MQNSIVSNFGFVITVTAVTVHYQVNSVNVYALPNVFGYSGIGSQNVKEER